MQKVISFSLWGKSPHFLQGAIENAKIINSQLYIGWEARFYVSEDVDDKVIDQLKELGANVVPSSSSGGFHMLYDRFLPLTDTDVDYFIVRDCDSRPSDKEYKAVMSWLNTPFQFHCMRDHKYHNFPIMGGMWGAKQDGSMNLSNVFEYLKGSNASQNYNDDQMALANFYQQFSYNFLEHDDYQRFNGLPFPPHNGFLYGSFIGERINADNTPGPLERWSE